jgi:hypothetical protein
MMDEQFLVGLADKVHCGQEGRVLNGLVSGGRCFGYRNIAIEDPNRTTELVLTPKETPKGGRMRSLATGSFCPIRSV